MGRVRGDLAFGVKRELEPSPLLRKLLAAVVYTVYREYCCRHWSEDCEDLEGAAYEALGVDLYGECEDTEG